MDRETIEKRLARRLMDSLELKANAAALDLDDWLQTEDGKLWKADADLADRVLQSPEPNPSDVPGPEGDEEFKRWLEKEAPHHFTISRARVLRMADRPGRRWRPEASKVPGSPEYQLLSLAQDILEVCLELRDPYPPMSTSWKSMQDHARNVLSLHASEEWSRYAALFKNLHESGRVFFHGAHAVKNEEGTRCPLCGKDAP